MKNLLVIFLAALLPLVTTLQPAAAKSEPSSLVISQPWAAHTGKRTMSAAAYFTISNTGNTADTLTGVKSDSAEMSTLHRSYEEDGIMRMDHIPALQIPAGGQVALSPGGYHIMLMQLAIPLKRGETFPLTLVFEKAGEVPVIVNITGIGGPEH
ncbi:MAG: copper chaperone PCu(A)C [Kordiimonadaceae bacterium]|nr:copper chaperone PCu(A)C [Kordiimonadaceae bacterium]